MAKTRQQLETLQIALGELQERTRIAGKRLDEIPDQIDGKPTGKKLMQTDLTSLRNILTGIATEFESLAKEEKELLQLSSTIDGYNQQMPTLGKKLTQVEAAMDTLLIQQERVEELQEKQKPVIEEEEAEETEESGEEIEEEAEETEESGEEIEEEAEEKEEEGTKIEVPNKEKTELLKKWDELYQKGFSQWGKLDFDNLSKNQRDQINSTVGEITKLVGEMDALRDKSVTNGEELNEQLREIKECLQNLAYYTKIWSMYSPIQTKENATTPASTPSTVSGAVGIPPLSPSSLVPGPALVPSSGSAPVPPPSGSAPAPVPPPSTTPPSPSPTEDKEVPHYVGVYLRRLNTLYTLLKEQAEEVAFSQITDDEKKRKLQEIDTQCDKMMKDLGKYVDSRYEDWHKKRTTSDETRIEEKIREYWDALENIRTDIQGYIATPPQKVAYEANEAVTVAPSEAQAKIDRWLGRQADPSSPAGSMETRTAPSSLKRITDTFLDKNHVRVTRTAINTGLLGTTTSNIVSVQKKADENTFVTDLHFNPHELSPHGEMGYLDAAVKLVKDHMSANPFSNESLTLKGKLPEPLVKQIARFCAHAGYTFVDKTDNKKKYHYDSNDSDVKNLGKKLVELGFGPEIAKSKKEKEKDMALIKSTSPTSGNKRSK